MRVTLAALLLVASTASPLPAQTQGGQTTLQQFQRLEDDWSVALAHKDQYALENLLSPTFVDIAASGAVNTRNQSIVDTLGGVPEPLLSVEQKVVSVRVVSDIAIVEGTYVLRLKQGPRTRDERGVFTHVYQRARNLWTCISAQRTAVVDQLEASRGKTATTPVASEKKSNAALPFHIPLLYKGAESSAPPTPSSVNNPPQ